jgi:class 3 adenylate cyclase
MRILVVDDEPGILQICGRALRAEGHLVETCSSGEEALPRLDGAWDLVLSDVRMGGAVDGHEVARRAAAGGSAVALMTAYPTLDSAVAAVRAGACDYLYKPFSLQALRELVSRLRAAPGRLAAPPAIEPRRLREATVLFADVRGFTAFSESLPPEEAAARLDDALARFIAAVHAEGGEINKLTGDGAMAVFGAPLPHPDPAGAAARAAQRTRDEVAASGLLRFGFGVNTGLVAAGRLGSGGSSEYGVIGAVVNVAARLQEVAEPGRILAGEETARRLDGRFRVAAAVPLRLKGLRSPVAAFEVLDLIGN